MSALLSTVAFGLYAGSAFAESQLSKSVNALVGTPYKWSGTDTNGFDCSGFTSYVFVGFGIELPHSSKAQANEGFWVSKEDLRPGDLVFFNTSGKDISHVGIYVGNNLFVHSATNLGVTFTSLDDPYYAKRYITARRVIGDELYQKLMAEAS